MAISDIYVYFFANFVSEKMSIWGNESSFCDIRQ